MYTALCPLLIQIPDSHSQGCLARFMEEYVDKGNIAINYLLSQYQL